MTGWLNLDTPGGREHVGHHRVDHETKEYAREPDRHPGGLVVGDVVDTGCAVIDGRHRGCGGVVVVDEGPHAGAVTDDREPALAHPVLPHAPRRTDDRGGSAGRALDAGGERSGRVWVSP